jgi:hypothetical protein
MGRFNQIALPSSPPTGKAAAKVGGLAERREEASMVHDRNPGNFYLRSMDRRRSLAVPIDPPGETIS